MSGSAPASCIYSLSCLCLQAKGTSIIVYCCSLLIILAHITARQQSIEYVLPKTICYKMSGISLAPGHSQLILNS